MLERNEPPPPEIEEPDDPRRAAVKTGARRGAIAGLGVGLLYVSSQSVDTPVGAIYVDNIYLALGIPAFVGAALGAAVGWLDSVAPDAP